MARDPDEHRETDTRGKAVPPYEGRRKSADVESGAERSGSTPRRGGATGPVEDGSMKAPDPRRTPGGATGSPADEQPARRRRDGSEPDDEGTGPSHQPGVGRAEKRP
ncbi:hypothetical protein AB0910_06065 [Streptomyces sp. NPDC047002]|uniref:hypothetical protein n=1 Tax=Streptomyces sp. NPDC047002 TaxID=3155475 RepID=UPI0034569AB6